MRLTVVETIFNRELEGKAIKVRGMDSNKDSWNDLCLVKKVDTNVIILTNIYGFERRLIMDDFLNQGKLKITVLVEGDEVK